MRIKPKALAAMLGVLALSAIIVLLFFRPGSGSTSAPARGASGASPITVTVHLARPPEPAQVWTFPHSAGMTVLDAMNLIAAPKGPQAALVYTYTGSGETAFLTSIQGVANEGGGAGARNWVFSVNGVKAQRGMGATVLNPGDRVDWTFEAYRGSDEATK